MVLMSDRRKLNLQLNILFLIIPFFRPDCIALANQSLDIFFVAWRIFAFLLATYYYFRRFTFNKAIFLILLYEIMQICASIINDVSVSAKIINMANFIGIYMIFSYFSKVNSKELINVVYKWLSFLICINAILTVFFPNGLNHALSDTGRINFMGLDNTITLYFILTMAFCVLYQNIHPDSIKPLFTFLVIVGTELFYKSGSGLIALFMIIIYLMFCSRNKYINKLANANLILIIYAVLEITIVFMNRINYLSFVFTALGKSSTFTDRRFYWDQALKQFMSSPIWGPGGGTVDLWNNGYYSHNALLDVLLKGGIIATAIWIVLLYFCLKFSEMKQNEFIQGFFRVLIFSALVYGLMEGLEDRVAFNSLLSLMLVLPQIERNGCLQNTLLNINIRNKPI